MDKSAREFLRQLLATPSPSGFEQKIQAVVRKRLSGAADEVTTDVHGNVMAVLNRGGSPRVMLAGHCDEIGLIVTHVDDKGFIYFDRIGGPDPACMLGMRVRIQADGGEVLGVIGKAPIHLESADQRGKGVKIDELEKLYVDIGARDRKDALKRVAVGDPMVYDEGMIELANGRIAARACDDRVGVFVVVEALRALADGKGDKLNAEVWAVSSVQEEVGLRGATTAAYAIAPDVGIAVDVGFASDHPGVDPKKVGEVKLGGGPMLHRGANINPVLEKLLADAAKKHKIDTQTVGEGRIPGTDAAAMQVTQRGVATAIVGVPNRYMHTPVEVVSTDDLDAAVKLLAAAIRSMKKNHDFTPR
ncbi:MAG: putative aminopeptidase YsdC [Phycisphaerae bacterium]|nr:putative aminopeptidase YsdC [Phycisphaerae bacterium]